MMKWWKKLAGKPKRAIPQALKFKTLVRRVAVDAGGEDSIGGISFFNGTAGRVYVTVEADFEKKEKPARELNAVQIPTSLRKVKP